MKHNWEYKRLGDVATYVNGYAFKPTDWIESGYPIIRIQNLNNSNAIYNYSNGNIPSKYFVSDGDLLISWSASLGAYIWHGEKAVLNQHIFKVIFDKTDIIKNYLKYFVDFSLPLMASKTHGATMRHITKPSFDALPIPFPPMEVQEKIVAELDKINEVIADCRELLRNLDALAQSLFYDFFGDPITNPKAWKVKIVKEVAKVKIGPFGSCLHKEDYISGGTPLVNPIHMLNGYIKVDNDFTIDNVKREELINYLLKSNDIVFGRRGDIGRCALVTSNEDGYLCGTGSLFVRFSININPLFSLWCFHQPAISQYLIEKAKGATMLNINSGIIESIPLILPPLALQEKFAARIEQIEEQKKAVEQTIAELQTLLDSRMDYWFN